MNCKMFTISLLYVALGAGVASADKAVEDNDLGLSKASVFDTPVPTAYAYTDADPEDVDKLPRAFPGAPPQIPHEIATMTPITVQENQCLDCHDKPRYVGKDIKDKAPMSESHYATTGDKPKDWKLSGARFNCTQCHVMQTDAKPLVGNTFVNVLEK